ncbi:hypothetical protein [Coxiella burnetii]|uniref:hypothetical protein n=1 Tax=Coxiella burnetii TaxID=777 RepID=UPI000183CE7C|nr:hypothetical protein [Coxiella burnetii]ACJ17523.1 hypothetical protein CbuG_0065 [Coxiella burnetii CbuG_Q212]OYK87101.1 hypothetical protein CbuQ229_00305 [Coxiella burnetii]
MLYLFPVFFLNGENIMPKTSSEREVVALRKQLKVYEKEMEKLQNLYQREIEKVAKSAYEMGLLEAGTGTVKHSVLKRIEAKKAAPKKSKKQTKKNRIKKSSVESLQEASASSIEIETPAEMTIPEPVET